MEAKNQFEMKISSTTSNDGFVRSTVAAFCAELNPTVEELNDVKTAVSEAFTNCVVHAYLRDTSKIVEINVFLYENEVEIVVRDRGQGISDVQKAMQPFFTTKPEEERSGMGFTLMQAFMSNVSVESEEGVGTVVKMKKTFGRC